MSVSLQKAIVVVLLVLATLVLQSNNPVLAANPYSLGVTIQKGDPVLGGISSAVTLQVSNPANNNNPVVNFTVLQPPGWSLVSCTPGPVYLDHCKPGSAKLSFYGTGLPLGAAVSLSMVLVPPTGAYPSFGNFSTEVRDASALNVTYFGPVFSLMIIDPTTTVSVTPPGTLGYVAGSGPLTVTAALVPSQGGVPVSFVVLGYGLLENYSIIPQSANTGSSGALSTSFAPSSNNGATATILAIVGTSVINGSSGRITTLSPGPSVNLSMGSGPAGTPVTMSGRGFLVGPVSVEFNNLLVGSTNVTSTGAAFAVPFVVPDSPPGVYVARASGLGGVTAAEVFQLVAVFDFRLSLSSNSTLVGPGQHFSTNVSASGLLGTSGVVAFSVGAQAGVTTPTLTPSVGTQALLNGTAPTSPGTFNYTVTASAGNLTHSIRFVIVVPPPSISLSKNSSLPGDSVTLTGQDFPPSTSFTVTLNQTGVESIRTDAAGSFQIDFVVPSVGPGNYIVGVVGGGAPVAAPFVVLAAPSSTTTTGGGGGPPVPWTYVAVAGGITAGGLAVAWRALAVRPPKPDDIRFTVEVVPEEEVTSREEEG